MFRQRYDCGWDELDIGRICHACCQCTDILWIGDNAGDNSGAFGDNCGVGEFSGDGEFDGGAWGDVDVSGWWWCKDKFVSDVSSLRGGDG